MSRQTTTRRRHGVRRMSERKRLTITAISAVLALVTVVICALTGVFNFHKGNERILPNLVGQTEESAKAQLAELDAEPSITYENSDETKGTVTVTCGAGGSVSPSGNQKVAEGGSVSFTITPKDGYEVATLVIDGTTVLPLTSYSFMNVDSNHTLYVTFREK